MPAEVKAQRNNELLAVQSEISLQQRRALVGEALEVLVEGYSKFGRREDAAGHHEAGCATAPDSEQARGNEVGTRRTRQLVGRTPHDLIVVFDGAAEHIGALVNVRVEAATALTLFGHIERVVSPARAQPGAQGLNLPVLS